MKAETASLRGEFRWRLSPGTLHLGYPSTAQHRPCLATLGLVGGSQRRPMPPPPPTQSCHACSLGKDVLAAKCSGVLMETEPDSPPMLAGGRVLGAPPDGVVTPSARSPKPRNLQADSNMWLWASSRMSGWGTKGAGNS